MDNLKNLRIKTRLSQAELATRAGVARWKLSMAENGRLLENGQCPLRPEEQAAVLEVLQAQFREIVEDAQVFSNLLATLYTHESPTPGLRSLPRSRQRSLNTRIHG